MRNVLSVSSSLVLLALAACTANSGGTNSGSTTSSGGPSPSPSPTPSPGTIPVTCAPVTGSGTTHSGDVGANAVWTAAGSPHIVTQNVNVRDGATLTIEPCAEVRLGKGIHINVAHPITPNTGTLVAEGTATQPIRFVGLDGARWASLNVRAPGTARLAHVTLEGGGGGDFQEGASLVAYGDGEDGSDPIVSVEHVTVLRSLGTGAWLSRGASFAAGSSALTIRESGSLESPWPIEISEHAIDTLPDGSYTGNKKDEILVAPEGGKTGGSGLLADATLHDRGVPYQVGRSKQHSLLIGGRTDDKLVTLTIEPGVVLRFTKGSALKVQHFTNLEPSTAALRAIGTAAKPIVFTSDADAPAPGDWLGLWFGGVPDASNAINHVRIQYAGYDCGCILNTCSQIAQHEGAVIITAQPSKPFITNTVFSSIAGHGITQGFDGTFVDLKPTNTFEGVSGCEQTRPRNLNTSCPSPRPACE